MYSDNFKYNNEIIDSNLLSDKDIKNLKKNDNIFLFLNDIAFFKDIPNKLQYYLYIKMEINIVLIVHL